MGRLDGKRFIVTGGSKGIGKAIARNLRAEGALVVITGRDAPRLERAAHELGAHPVTADVGVEADAVRSVREAVALLGGLDGLVNNAAIGGWADVEELDAAEFRRLLDVNVIGAAVMTRECVPHLRAAGGGDIVLISSTSGLKGDAGATMYSASKFGLRAMGQCWQAELRKHDIRVIVVNPSLVQTGFGTATDPSSTKPNLLYAEDIAHAVTATLTMHRRGFVPELTVFATNPWR